MLIPIKMTVEQVSVTQQLEMRHLNSAMKPESNVQIIVTEPSVNLDQDHVTQKSLKALTSPRKTAPAQVRKSKREKYKEISTAADLIICF